MTVTMLNHKSRSSDQLKDRLNLMSGSGLVGLWPGTNMLSMQLQQEAGATTGAEMQFPSQED